MDVPHNHVEEDLQLFDMHRIKSKRNLDAVEDDTLALEDTYNLARPVKKADGEDEASSEEGERGEEDGDSSSDEAGLPRAHGTAARAAI